MSVFLSLYMYLFTYYTYRHACADIAPSHVISLSPFSGKHDDDIGCFCTTKGYSAIIKDAELYNGICKDWLVSAGKKTGVGILASGAAAHTLRPTTL